MDILKKYLNKLGVKEFSELTTEEKETYRGWEEALRGRKITDEEVSVFLDQTENDIINELVDKQNNDRRDIYLKVQLDLIRKIRSFLNVPKVEKLMTERNINNLIEK